jgi:nitroimidazol reductase NimA-like FMN-containing flavoprotein (pyridoxamine 5'-phosphate oxidase superfamily)
MYPPMVARSEGVVVTIHTWRIEIPPEECEELLAGAVLGRLGVVVDGRPEIFPVNHVYDTSTGSIAFPTNERTKWRAALEWPWVAFEVDGMDADRTSGWSVAVVGRAEEITDPAEIARMSQRRTVACTGGRGPGTHWLRIVRSKMTGWRITAYE